MPASPPREDRRERSAIGFWENPLPESRPSDILSELLVNWSFSFPLLGTPELVAQSWVSLHTFFHSAIQAIDSLKATPFACFLHQSWDRAYRAWGGINKPFSPSAVDRAATSLTGIQIPRMYANPNIKFFPKFSLNEQCLAGQTL